MSSNQDSAAVFEEFMRELMEANKDVSSTQTNDLNAENTDDSRFDDPEAMLQRLCQALGISLDSIGENISNPVDLDEDDEA